VTEAPPASSPERSFRWAELSENIPVGIYVLQTRPDGTLAFLFASRCWLAMLDLELDALLGDPSLAFARVHPEEREAFTRLNAQRIEAAEVFFWEGRLLVNGQVRWVRITSTPSPLADGGLLWEGVMVDISDLKQQELQLQRRQQELTRILDNLPVAIAGNSLDPEPRLLFVNARFVATFGYTLDDIPTLAAWAELAYPDPGDRQAAMGSWAAAVERARERAGTVESMAFQVVNKAGDRLDVLIGAIVLEDMLLVSLVDVTEQRRMEAELQIARRSLADTALAITEAIPVGTYTMVKQPGCDLASFSFISERFLEICGLEREAATSDPLLAFACVHPDDYDAWVALNAHVFAHKLPFRGETRLLVDGRVRWILAESVPRDLADGTTVWEGVISDVTERVLAQQRLQESEKNLLRILENLPIPMGLNRLQAPQPVLFFNRCFSETFGYSLDTMPTVDAWFAQAYPHPLRRRCSRARWQRDLEAAMASDGRMPPRLYRVTAQDGSWRDVLISAVVLDDQLVAAFLDVSERRRAQLELALARRRERQLRVRQRHELERKLRSSLTAAAMAHEIQQPLSTLLIGARLALSAFDQAAQPGSPALRHQLEIQLQQARQLQLTTEKMRSLLRNVQTPHHPVDLTQVVESSLLFLQRSLEQCAITPECAGLGRSIWIAGDGAQLQMAIANLLRNAIEALQDAAVPDPRIRITLGRERGMVELRVDDNGPGFPPGTLEEVPLVSTKDRGMGIGLFVVRTTAENHAGTLSVARSPHGGAAVRLRFPALPAGESTPPPPPLP
jgi:PAS domain S-box-containing protein